MTFKPLLAAEADLDNLTFPLILSPKIDGIRCLIHPGLGPVTRTLKPIPNRHIRQALNRPELYYMDGEIITHTGRGNDSFNAVQSKVMTEAGEPGFTFFAFDLFRYPDQPFDERRQFLKHGYSVHHLEQITVHDMAELMELEDRYVKLGFEGVMLRRPDGPYKFGRSTAREGILLKLKRFDDSEGVVMGAIEQMHNANEARTNALGHTERSSHKGNLVPTGVLGALQVRLQNGIEFELGTGFDAATRADLWQRRAQVIGLTVNFKHQGFGTHGRPRFPSFRGMRYDVTASLERAVEAAIL